jgi:RNA polymerase sigma-70 factor (ECF subfamily)
MSVDKITEEDLLKACLAGNGKAQHMLYDRFAGKMMGVCMRYVKSHDDAQDVLQDGFVKVFQRLHTFKLEGSLEGWIRRIMVNTALDALRRDKEFQNSVSTDDVHYKLEKNDYIIENMNAENLLRILNSIPTGYKVVFNLFAIEGYSHQEIADQLGISVNTSKSQYSRAREYMQKVLIKQKAI